MGRTKGTLTDMTTGEITQIDIEGIDALTAGKMRSCERDISSLDTEIERLKDELKTTREERENLIANLRGYVRGERALPFGDSDD